VASEVVRAWWLESARSVNGTCMNNVTLQGNDIRCSPVAVFHY